MTTRPIRLFLAKEIGRPVRVQWMRHEETAWDTKGPAYTFKIRDLPHYGAGEAACRPAVAAVANAIYDTTGVRIRRVPFRDGRVLAALKATRV